MAEAGDQARAPREVKGLLSPVEVHRLHFPGEAEGSRDVEFQHSVHSVRAMLRRELNLVFPERRGDGDPKSALVAVPTVQRSVVDLAAWGPAAAAEKDRLLRTAYAWCTAVCDELEAAGHWADFVDPPSGYPARGARGGAMYNEVQGIQTLLRFRTDQAGTCHLLLHPQWGASCYPVTLFSTAPAADVARAAANASRRFAAPL
jgi:cobalamin trafficking protein CblD